LFVITCRAITSHVCEQKQYRIKVGTTLSMWQILNTIWY